MVSSRFIFLIIITFIFQSCSDSRYDVDTSVIDYNLDIKRMDRDLFENRDKNAEWLELINNKYGSFAPIYFEEIMRIGSATNPMTASLAGRFTQDPTWSELQQIIEKRFPSLQNESVELEQALKRYAVQFNADSLPSVVAYNSGYNVGVYPSDQWLGVGLEWYCGTKHPIVEQLPPDLFPQYKIDKMIPEFMVPNIIKGHLFYQFRSPDHDKNLLSRMVHSGKVLFTTTKLLGNKDFARVLNYTNADYKWCNEHAYDVWKYLVENDLFFIDDPMQVNKLMNDGPFTPGMPAESPGGVGNWVGLEMVKEFMLDHPKVTLQELINMENDRVFLEYYKFK